MFERVFQEFALGKGKFETKFAIVATLVSSLNANPLL